MKIFGRDLTKVGATDDEPLVLLRAADPFAPHMLRDYAARLDETGNAAGARAARDHAERIKAWQDMAARTAAPQAPPTVTTAPDETSSSHIES